MHSCILKGSRTSGRNVHECHFLFGLWDPQPHQTCGMRCPIRPAGSAGIAAAVAAHRAAPHPPPPPPGAPAEWDAERALKRGEERARQTRGLALIRGLYRRAVELWLVLDRAVAQEEAGRAVEVGTWCERTVTPRNLMIISTHPERQRRPVESNWTWGRDHGE